MLHLNLKQYLFQNTLREAQDVIQLIQTLNLGDIAQYDAVNGLITYTFDSTLYINLHELIFLIKNKYIRFDSQLYWKILGYVIEMVQELHISGVYHGNITPENIWLFLEKPINEKPEIARIYLIQHLIFEDIFRNERVKEQQNIDLAYMKGLISEMTSDDDIRELNSLHKLEQLKAFAYQMQYKGVEFQNSERIYRPLVTQQSLTQINEQDFQHFFNDAEIGIILKNNILSELTKKQYFQTEAQKLDFGLIVRYLKEKLPDLIWNCQQNYSEKQKQRLKFILKQNGVFNSITNMKFGKYGLFFKLVKFDEESNHPFMKFEKCREQLYKRNDWYQKYEEICNVLNQTEVCFKQKILLIFESIKLEIQKIYKDDKCEANYEKYLQSFDAYLSDNHFKKNQSLLLTYDCKTIVNNYVKKYGLNEVKEQFSVHYKKVNSMISNKMKFQ